jgi:hypothetical protein
MSAGRAEGAHKRIENGRSAQELEKYQNNNGNIAALKACAR